VSTALGHRHGHFAFVGRPGSPGEVRTQSPRFVCASEAGTQGPDPCVTARILACSALAKHCARVPSASSRRATCNIAAWRVLLRKGIVSRICARPFTRLVRATDRIRKARLESQFPVQAHRMALANFAPSLPRGCGRLAATSSFQTDAAGASSISKLGSFRIGSTVKRAAPMHR
jgi:hypothetical protein